MLRASSSKASLPAQLSVLWLRGVLDAPSIGDVKALAAAASEMGQCYSVLASDRRFKSNWSACIAVRACCLDHRLDIVSAGMSPVRVNLSSNPSSSPALLRGLAAALAMDTHSDRCKAALIARGFVHRLLALMWHESSNARSSAMAAVVAIVQIPPRELERVISSCSSPEQAHWHIVQQALVWCHHRVPPLSCFRLTSCSPLAAMLVLCDVAISNIALQFEPDSWKLCEQVPRA